ncbi:DNA topoisomerase I [Sulfuricella denitrificans skB26]|uniref:DNA topoisomerase 1 n=1 Tax=Sulfuricella denitrificans (strain DSM 22764 / NBRC 105220 / skB26) TaxID=1163617 RepID=S6A9C2_SULDS|nr:type I DNA topoisomerase [Sulfuricella denitrificans]BAN33855.1 DNA topoisomerase I [Sulfuricella denitrificans skB26]
MSSSLLIVESPSKAKTLKKYLGKDFEILASYGHVRDLVPKQGAVDTENDFKMKYQLIERNAKHVDAITKAVKLADNIYLATDPDREGEAIAWHLAEILKSKKLLAKKNVKRVVFHEITQSAVLAAIANPRDILMPLVNAQQARRALDYLVGFNLSPLLWRKIRRGLSAGRVQSPALRLICEREIEIDAFKTQEYWSIHFDSHKGKQKFSAKLFQYKGEKLNQFSVGTESAQADIVDYISQRAGGKATVVQVDKKRKQRQASAPFTTSTLQQEAVRKLGFTTDRAMRVAQQLYEGVDTGGGAVGLITYMRTDAVILANEALTEIRDYISAKFDPDYLPKAPVLYKNKSKNAQEAHEAIRPTSILRTPDDVRTFLTADQIKLYEMIWKRTLACQMSPAKFDTVSLDLAVADEGTLFRASGQTLVFPGFIAVYLESEDDQEEEGESKLPPMEAGDQIPVDKLYGDQHFTQPPPRYTEASLVKDLEEHGIGRPSTYASIISTLQAREYVNLDKKRFFPTDVGSVVNKFLTEHFTRYVDYDFTAKLEDQLDIISIGEKEWIPVLADFWKGFSQQIDEKKNIERKDLTHEQLDEACPKCGKPLSVRLGKRGKFVGCSAYPECDFTRSMDGEVKPDEPVVVEGRLCPKCDSPLHVKSGAYGKFIGCSAYPKCKFLEPLEKPKDTGVICPECKKGSLIERKSRYGKLFYSCNTYPDCKYAVWNPPVAEPCPKCNWPVLTIKTTKRRGTEKVCPQKECGYTEPVATAEE